MEILSESDVYGILIVLNLIGVNYQYFFNFCFDMDVDGIINMLIEMNVVLFLVGLDNFVGNVFVM